jgi:hypothetical protein
MLKNTENIALRSLHIFSIFVLRAEIVTIFGSQGYIFCILQHFVTKFCNFTNFNKFFTGIYFFLPRSKICLTCKLSILSLLHVIQSITFARRRKIADRIASVNQA